LDMRLRVVDSMQEHPVKWMLGEGLFLYPGAATSSRVLYRI
jgi:hypothetical protein